MLSKFNIDRFILDGVAVMANANYNPQAPKHVANVETSIAVDQNKTDPRRYQVRLQVKVEPKKGQEGACLPYNVQIAGRAFYLFKEAPTQAEAEHILQLNGASILYGLFRGQVSQITAQGQHGQMLLPALNFLELQKRLEEDKQSLQPAPPGQSAPPEPPTPGAPAPAPARSRTRRPPTG